MEMAGRHRGMEESIHIVKTVIVPAKELRRVQTINYAKTKLAFPVPNQLPRPPTKRVRSTYTATRPNTMF
jgi:hypothetical protein